MPALMMARNHGPAHRAERKTMKITRERWEQIEKHLSECGYMALTDADRSVCDAWDKGTLKFSDDPLIPMSGLVKYADWIIGGTMLAGWLVVVVVMVLS